MTSCLDDGSAGTLRSVIAGANDLDTVDLSGLTPADPGCSTSTITLGTGSFHGHIVIDHNITIQGPGANTLTVDGSQLTVSNVFFHQGGGDLSIDHLNVTGGDERTTSSADGGCIYSNGNVFLVDSTVTGCTAYSPDTVALGGGIYAKGNVYLSGSYVDGNSLVGFDARGGGVFARGFVKFKYRDGVVANNVAGYALAAGGGVYAEGRVYSTNGTQLIAANYAYANSGNAYGGGISTNFLALTKATIKYNTAKATVNAYGGGVSVAGALYLNYATVRKNRVDGSSSSAGGGLHATGNVGIDSSTISGNTSSVEAGGIDASNPLPGNKILLLVDSTISNNSAVAAGGVFSDVARVRFYNSTIAFNSALSHEGVEISGFVSPVYVLLHSTLISNNTRGNTEDDVFAYDAGAVTFGAQSSNNIVHATLSSIPGTSSSCPLLGPLRDNGGLTETHALLSGSPAIDAGDDVFGIGYDQRGSASMNGTVDYPRPSGGSDTTPDIGAYEVQQADIVFDAGFDGCP